MSEPTPAPSAGTDLAPGPSMATSRYQAVRAVHTRATANEWARLRPLRTLPTILVVTPLLFASGYARWRVAAVLVVQVLCFLQGVLMAARAKRLGIEQRSLYISHLILVTGHAIVISLTGGFTSPLWPGLVGPTLGTFYVFGRERESTVAGVYAAILVVAIALLPAELCGPLVPRPYHVALLAWSILFSLYIMRTSAVALSDGYTRIGETLDQMREDVIAAAEARAKGLECVGSKVAHELKNPLSAVKGLVQLLSRSAADDRSRERLEVIAGEVTRMEGILRDYLTFSRPLTDLAPEPVELSAIADEVLAVLEARSETARVSMRCTGGPVMAEGDRRRLKEALLNLVANALEATPPGGSVEVEISGAPDEAILRVRDTGKGIKPEDLLRLGTPFFTTREGGTGLGVVLARAAIRQHGGDLRFESELGHGTVATVRLPTRRKEARAPAAPAVGVEAVAHG